MVGRWKRCQDDIYTQVSLLALGASSSRSLSASLLVASALLRLRVASHKKSLIADDALTLDAQLLILTLLSFDQCAVTHHTARHGGLAPAWCPRIHHRYLDTLFTHTFSSILRSSSERNTDLVG